MSNTNGSWIWTDDWGVEDAREVRLVRFRTSVSVESIPTELWLICSADTRYKLYINGTLVQFGPAKGDDKVRYFDRVNLTPWLGVGENIMAVEVLRYPTAPLYDSNHSLFRSETPGLYVDCALPLNWRSQTARKVKFCAEEQGFSPLHFHENVSEGADAKGWKLSGYDDSGWKGVSPVAEVPEILNADNLKPRPIPFMRRAPGGFVDLPEMPMCFPAHAEQSVVLDAGEEMTGFIRLNLIGGVGASIELMYSECYEIPTGNGYVKQLRTDSVNGVLRGYSDHYSVAGNGVPDAPEVYEPFWFRTFRFVKVSIRTKDQPLTIARLDYEETSYPLEAKTCVETSDPTMADIWDISLRSLKRCMHETYMDCPFYEQMQYAMDTRSQILYTYAVSADDRLARNAIDDFSRSQRPDGLLNCSYPNINTHVIPGFSIYFILMLHDHMMYFGNRALIRRYMPTVEGILDFFGNHLTGDGLVDKVGGVLMKSPFWSFIDWASEWLPTSGMPGAGLNGPITMESLLYVLGLQRAAELAVYIEQGKVAEGYRTRAKRVQAAIRTKCMTPEGMIADGPENEDVSQHGQVFGILTDTLSAEEGRRNLRKTVEDNSIPQCTVAMCFYLFRALEKTGLYAYTDQYWNVWREMVKNGCTTCVESQDYARSECHGWGALALYELPTVTLGVRPAAPGYGKISIRPVPGTFTHANGTVHTLRGEIGVAWKLGEPVQIRCDESLRRDIIHG